MKEGKNKHANSLYISERCKITTYLTEISSVNFPTVGECLTGIEMVYHISVLLLWILVYGVRYE